MERDPLISAWQGANTTSKNNADLIAMLREGQHPVLKHLRKQLIIEIIAFTLFLILYYDFFDGDKKPLYANLFIVAGMLLVITHNILGYIFSKRSFKGDNIKQSLKHYLVVMKKHAIISIMCRALMVACLFIFFTSVIQFTPTKYWALAAGVAVLLIQLMVLWGVWLSRIRKLKNAIASLAS